MSHFFLLPVLIWASEKGGQWGRQSGKDGEREKGKEEREGEREDMREGERERREEISKIPETSSKQNFYDICGYKETQIALHFSLRGGRLKF